MKEQDIESSQPLLGASSTEDVHITHGYSTVQLLLAATAGAGACLLAQFVICGGNSMHQSSPTEALHGLQEVPALAPPWVGSSVVHNYPPPTPTNAFPSLFPTDVGHAGGTPTGAEAGVVATAPGYPVHTGAANLVQPASMVKAGPKLASWNPFGHKNKKAEKFDLFRTLGNLSPWYSVPRGAFGIDASPHVPEGCSITGMHLLHRHGARYPTAYASYGGPANFSSRLNAAAAGWNASGELDFMNSWSYKLGEEILTPYGRQQLYDLGISMRLKYGFLLENFTATNTLPVFRTESQDRMLASAMNFALGFFGWPLEGKYQQSITIEAKGVNNTLAPYATCDNAGSSTKADRGRYYVDRWAQVYLKDANARLAARFTGYDLSIEDTYVLQQLCAYETVALGYSKFCELFTEEEWEGFNYALDLNFWYDSAFGSPVARVQGIGYVQELVARLTHTPIKTHNSSTNSTLNDNPITFPLGQSLYVDATHEVVILNILTALNLSNFAAGGPLPADHIPENRSFRVSELAPFGANVQFQLLSCETIPEPQIRIVINDGVTPLTGINGCPENAQGMCAVDTFVKAQKEIIRVTDWDWGCGGDWDVLPGVDWQTTTGDAPKKA